MKQRLTSWVFSTILVLLLVAIATSSSRAPVKNAPDNLPPPPRQLWIPGRRPPPWFTGSRNIRSTSSSSGRPGF